MRTIGKVFRDSRIHKKISPSKLEELTKIKEEFIRAIENEDWELLPEYPSVLGFVKSISGWIGVDSKKAIALLRRDYPPKDVKINPKPDISKKFIWSPKLTFLVGISVVIMIVALYLGVEYKKFISPPRLDLVLPREGQLIDDKHLMVKGSTDVDSTVKVNNQPVLVDENGNFSFELDVSEKTEKIVVVAQSRSGRETTLERHITLSSDN